MNTDENLKQRKEQMLLSFIVRRGLSDQFMEFVESAEDQDLIGYFENQPLRDSAKSVDQSLVRIYVETKELIEWYGLSAIVACLSKLASDHLFTYKPSEQHDMAEAAVQAEQLLDETQLMLGLIRFLTNVNHQVRNAEQFRKEASGHLLSKYPDLTNNYYTNH